MKKLLTVLLLVLVSASWVSAQTHFSDEIYGTGKMGKNQIDFAYSVDPNADSIYLLSGVDNMDTIPMLPPGLHNEYAPPQARIFRIMNGQLLPVWEWPQEGHHHDFSQWGLTYQPSCRIFANSYDPQGNGQDHHYAEIFDSTFHGVKVPVMIPDMHELLVEVEGTDTFIYVLDYTPYGYRVVKLKCTNHFQTRTEVWSIQPSIADTAQTRLRQGSCLDGQGFINIGDPNEFFHPNSICLWRDGDSVLICVSERNTGMIRCYRVHAQNGGYRQCALIGSSDNVFSTEHWIDDSVFLEGGHNFRMLKSWGADSFLCTYYDDGVCPGTTASGLVFIWSVTTHTLRLVQDINHGLQSNAMGSFQAILKGDTSLAAVLAAPKLTCHGIGKGHQPSAGAPYGGFFPPEDGGQIDLRYPGALKPLLAMVYTNLMNWGGKLRVTAAYCAIAYYQNQLPNIWQPTISCSVKGTDSIKLSIAGLIVDSWNNNSDDSSLVITVAKNKDWRYVVKGKTDTSMFGFLYSNPVWISNGQCLTSPPSEISGVNEAVAPAIQAYPNPSRGTLFVNIPEEGKIAITDALGRLVTQADVSVGTIRLEEIPNGVNFVTFTSKKGNKTTRKIVVE